MNEKNSFLTQPFSVLNKISKLFIAGIVAMSGVTVVHADPFAYTPVAGGTIYIENYLKMDGNANVPNATFSFSIAPGTAQNASTVSNVGYSQVFAGPTGTNAPAVGQSVFAQGQTTYSDATAIENTGTQTETGKTDPVTLSNGEKYARSKFSVNLTGVTFNEPGVYRYIVTESSSVTGGNGITVDTDASRVLDVYVGASGNDGKTLTVEGYVLHNSTDDALVPVAYAANNPTTKTNGFINSYTSYDLTLSKTVSGNQASRDEYFQFTVTFDGGVAGTVYNVVLDNADATTATTGNNSTQHTNSNAITLDSNGEATVSYWLQGGQSIIIRGLAQGTTYSIQEDNTLMDNEGYTTTGSVTGTGTFTAASRIATSAPASGTDTGIQANTTVAFTNARQGTIPTGVINSVLPGAIIIMIGIAGCLIIKRKVSE